MSRDISIFIVEDEALLAQDMAIRLSKRFAIAGIAHSVAQALEHLETQACPDLMLIDITLKGELDGIALAKMVKEQYDIPFIFLTSHADREVVDRAIRVQPHAYMLKPFNEREIFISIDLALANYAQRTHAAEPHSEPLETPESALTIRDSLFLRQDQRYVRVPLAEVRYLEADNNYTTVYTQTDKYIYSVVLRKMEEKLPPGQFVRVHRSYIINPQAVTGFEGSTLHLGEDQVPVSKSHREEVFRLFKSL